MERKEIFEGGLEESKGKMEREIKIVDTSEKL
jgi:hypothetical protein